MTKFLLLGLDGAEPSLIEKWKQDLPNLRNLIQSGAFGMLESSIPSISIPAWTCMGTGKNPGKIGAFSFLYREPRSYDTHLVNSSVIRARYLWNILSERERRVVVLNVPGTFPPEKVNGVLVSGLPAPENDGRLIYTYPSSLSRELDDLVGGYEVGFPWLKVGKLFETRTTFASVYTYDKVIEILNQTQEKQLKIASYLLDRESWDFGFVVFTVLDRISHLFWKFMDTNHPGYESSQAERFGDTIRKFYGKVDDAVGRLVSQAGDDTVVFVVSDHGFGPLHKKFHLNEWLRRLGLLSLSGRRRLQVSIRAKLPVSAEGASKFLLRHNMVKLLNATPKRIRRILRDTPFEDISSSIDWFQTRAYSYGAFGFIFFNVNGREPKGIVRRGSEYTRLQEKVIAALKGIRDPEGNVLVDQIWKGPEVYRGEYADLGPDLLLGMDGFTCRISSSLGRSRLFDSDPLTSGTHRPLGIFLAHGNGIRTGDSIQAHIYDIAPTILHAMNVPIPKDMDGRPLSEIFDPSSDFAKRKSNYEEVVAVEKTGYEWSAEEEELVKSQLKRLGYID